mgnify:CR=1 FL=1
MMNMMQIMQQAQKMQKKFKETQGELENIEVISTSGNGAVTAVLNGQGKFKSIKLTPEAINPSNPASVDSDTIEMLEDLLTEACDKAINQEALTELEEKIIQANPTFCSNYINKKQAELAQAQGAA